MLTYIYALTHLLHFVVICLRNIGMYVHKHLWTTNIYHGHAFAKD